MKPNRRYATLALPVAGALLLVILLLAAIYVAAGGTAAASAESPQVAGAAGSAPDVPANQADINPVPPAALRSIPPAPAERTGSPAAEVRRAWERARELGVYRFSTALVEKRFPAPSLLNVGSGPQLQEMRIEGDADLPSRKLSMRLWQGEVSAATPDAAAEIRVEGDSAYARGAGGSWLPVEDFSGSFAPGADLMSYLAGIKDVARLGFETRALPGSGEVRFTRYSFRMDGPALAAYMRDRLEQVLLAQGKLPPGVTVEAAREYRELTGEGEVWLDEQGLPLRLQLQLRFPPAANGAYSEAEVRSDFSGFPAPVAAALPASPAEVVAWAEVALAPAGRHAADWQAAGRSALAWAIAIALVSLILVRRRSRRVYTAVAVAVVLAMTVVPLMRSNRVAAYAGEQAAKQAAAEERLAGDASAAEFAAAQTSWDPTLDPLAGTEAQAEPAAALPALATVDESDDPCDEASRTADGDGDGLTDYEECEYGTDPAIADHDADGLNDGQELNKLGTNPVLTDSDGDTIADLLEVQGFVYPASGRHWYLDARNPDTNGDGWSDRLECPPLARGDTSATALAAECDTDADGIPNLFESDNDNDGVPDKVDISPNYVLDRDGVSQDAASVVPFTRDQPLSIRVEDLQPGWPAFLDLQLRPEVPQHLTYALNILDWPAADTDGQIQHAKRTTFATSDNPDIARPGDDAGAYGDMRLVPLLQIEMSGSSLPLKLAAPAVTVIVPGASPVPTATVSLEQDAADTSKTALTFDFEEAGAFSAQILASDCPGFGLAVWSGEAIADGQVEQRTGTADDGWLTGIADGHHALVISDGATRACATIPNIINGPYPNAMVDQAVLQPYGIGLQETGSGPTTEVLAYLPLNLVNDDTTGGRTAFSARMLYWPDEDNAWGEAQKLRMVWAVQGLTDACDTTDPEFPSSLEKYQETHPDAEQEDVDEAQREWCLQEGHRSRDELNIVQTYDDTFHVTGLRVREDHGLDVAVAYPDPGRDYDENPLWQLSWGLGHTFIPGRDCEDDSTIVKDTNPGICHNDGVRDLAVNKVDKAGVKIGNSTILERFGTSDPKWAGSDALWGIAQGALQVENHAYDTQDYLAKVAMEVTPAILDKFGHSVKPSLLFAREEHYRSAGLEAGTETAGTLVVSVGSAYGEETLAALSWAPFRYNPDPGEDGQPVGWEAYPLGEYYDSLNGRMKNYFKTLYPTDDDETIAGQAAMAVAYYVSLYNGIAGPVHPCPAGEEGESCPGNEESEPPEGLAEAAEKIGDVLVDITGAMLEELLEWTWHYKHTHHVQVWNGLLEEYVSRGVSAPLYKSLGHALTDFFWSPWKTFFGSGPKLAALGVGMGVVLAGALVTVALSIALGSSVSGAQLAQRIMLDIGLVLNTLVAVKAVQKYVQEAVSRGFEAVFEAGAEGAAKHAEGGITKGGVIRLAIQLVLLWAAFFACWGAGGLAFGSMILDDMAAGTLAWTLTAFLMFLILAALGPVGELIGAIIAAIDALARLICNAFLSEKQQESEWSTWLCGGISGIVKNVIKRAIYSGTILVEMEPEDFDRLTFGNLDVGTLTDPTLGVTPGNSFKPSIEVTSTIELAEEPTAAVSWSAQAFLWDADHLRRANFGYKWQAEEKDIHSGLSLDGIPEPGWQAVPGHSGRYAYHETVPAEEAFPLPSPGINQPASDVFLSEGYALPEAECWGISIFSGCGISAVKGTVHYPLGGQMKFDVLPDNLDGFRQLQGAPGGFRLAWDARFAALRDADGDGLAYGADPNDASWDTDADGLSDAYEVESGTNPALVDTDRDGLTDYEEGQLRTNPKLPDSDADGLVDCQEVYHRVTRADELGSKPGDVCGPAGSWTGGWDFVYGTANGAQQVTRVSANPTDPDADADSYSDAQEKIYGFHPGVPSQTAILTLNTKLTETQGGVTVPADGFVRPGSRLGYTAGVKNELDARDAEGLLWTEGGGALDVSSFAPQSFVLRPGEETSMTGNLEVSGSADEGPFSITQAAGALITNWSELSGAADLWLPLDDAPGATVYADRSGNIPARDGRCGGPAGSCAIAEGGGRVGSALQLNGTGYVEVPLDVSETAYAVALWFNTTCANCGIFSVDEGALGAGGHDRHLYLNQGNLCARVYNDETICASGQNLADGRWHHVVHTFGGNVGGQKLYVDGLLAVSGTKAASNFTWQDGVNIGFSSDAAQDYFTGQIDDVRLYPSALTAGQAEELVDEAIFSVNFEQHAEWTDASAFRAPIVCSGATCPTHVSQGATGWGAEFDGSDSLDVGASAPNAQLNLSDGHFTMAAWLQPKDGCVSGKQVSILGGSGYPTLFVDQYGYVGMVAGPYTIYAAPFLALTKNAWNHLVVTYDYDGDDYSVVKFYLNGELRHGVQIGSPGATPPPVPRANTRFYIGAIGDGNPAFCGKIDGVQIFRHVLDDAEVKEFRVESATALRLALDEPPGASAFHDRGVMQRAPACGASTCPTAGLAGRVDQAAGFNTAPGHTVDHLTLANSEINSLADRMTVAAWINLDELSPFYQHIGSTATNLTLDGWGFGALKGELIFNSIGDKAYASTGANLQPGRWFHVAAVVDGRTLQFYLNGQPLGAAITLVSAVLPDAADRFLIGAATSRSTGELTDFWHGLIDDLSVYHVPLSAAQIARLYNSAPVLHLRFDETYGATAFANGANLNAPASCATPETCPLTGVGIKGQLWLAAQFDGQNDVVTVPDFGAFTQTTVSAWVKRTGASSTRETLLSYKEAGDCGFALTLNEDGASQFPAFSVKVQPAGGAAVWKSAESAVPLSADIWQHLAGSYDGVNIRLYRNGNPAAQLYAPGAMAQCSATSSVGGRTANGPAAFRGLIDELRVFDHALTVAEMWDAYSYQLGWVEDRKKNPLTVDRTGPTGSVALPVPPYQANWPAQVLVQARDATSGVEKAQLCVGAADCSAAPVAPRCVEPGSDAAWCPIFSPNGEGVYSLSARITDRVGYVTTTAARQLYVDDSPPVVSLAPPANGSWYSAAENRDKSNTWTVRFSGAASDPQISPGAGGAPVAGSGVPDGGVRVTLYRADGGLVGAGPQIATVSGGAWSLDFLFAEADPSGCYRVVVEAVDQVGRTAGLPESQVARHTTVVEQQISVDGDSPYASIDWTNLFAGQLGPGATALGGAVSSRPVPVVLDFTGGSNSAQSGLVLTCQQGNQGSWWQPFSTTGATLAPGQAYGWGRDGRPVIHRGSSCQVQLATSAASDDLSGRVTVCGEEVLNWSGAFASPGRTLSFTADSSSCSGGNGCPQGTLGATAGIKGVDVSFLPVAPGSPFYNETASQGEILHLTMDSGSGGSGDPTFPDVSGNKLTGTCSGAACPSESQEGHTGRAALFDGADSIGVPQVTGQGTTNYLTVSAWVYPTKRSDGAWNQGTFASRSGLWSVACASDGQVSWTFRNANPGWSAHNTGYTAAMDRWTHIAVVVDNGVARTYANGALVETFNGSGSISNAAASNIGGEPASAGFFTGLLDEVRVFDRALAGSEVKALYTGAGPSLTLPFEKQWAADGAVLEDASGWQSDALLVAGSGDAGGKTVTGQVGRYALQLDGVDDHAVVPDSDAIDFDTGDDFAVAAWIKAAPAQGWTSTPDNNVVEKWSGSGGYPYVIRFLNQASADAGKIYASRWDGNTGPTLTSATRVDDGRFHHVAFVKSGSSLALYVDGARERQTTDTTTAATTNTSPLYIGRRGGSLAGYFAGSVDDVRVYPRSLSEPEVQALFLMGWQPATLSQSGPDVVTTRWTIEPPKWLEGSYRIEARGWDTDGHTSPPRSPVQTWSGEADTLAPRVTLVRSPSGAGYRYTTTAEDYNLAAAGLSTPCPGNTVTVTTDFQSPWYLAAYPASPRLYRLVQDCSLAQQAASETATACDTFGNCATAAVTLASAAVARVDGGVPASGPLASAGAAHEISLGAVDTTILGPVPAWPAIDFVPTVLTTTHLYPPTVIKVTGLVTGTQRIEEMTVSVGGASGPATITPGAGAPSTSAAWSYPWPLAPGELPDGVVVTAVATATLKAGGAPLTLARDLTVDVAPPAPVTLTLSSAGRPVRPGDTVRGAAPELLLSWPAATDGSGVAGYVARWSVESSAAPVKGTRAVAAGGPLEDRYTAGEAQRLTVDLASRDRYGNARWQTLGPVYVDSPLTPDLIGLGDRPYEGWQESGCALLGADRRLEWRSPGVGKPQRLYATWDRAALRLAWTGASWNSDGDLFVYLDTAPGGASKLFNPFAPSPGALQLSNEALQADLVVWVQDARRATLLAWDGSAWGAPVPLSADQYRFDPGREGGQTDLYLPFGLLGLAQGSGRSGLGLLAVAAAEPVAGSALQLWATLPQLNPVNSALVNRVLAFMPAGSQLALKHAYRWPALVDGVCPNGSNSDHPVTGFGDAQPQLSIASDPPGVGLSGLGRGLFWVTDDALARASELSRPGLEFLRAAFPPVDVGQVVRYTVRYRNAGTEAQRGVRLEFTGYGVELANSILNLGDVAAGAEAVATVEGRVVGAGPRGIWAAVHGLLYDEAHPNGEALDWLWAAHRLDEGGPETVSLSRLGVTVGPRLAALGGLAVDESGIRNVEVEIAGPEGTRTITCPVERPADGRWQCPWNVSGGDGQPGALPHGAKLTLRVRATDRLGHTSEWSSPRVVTVDARPPALDLSSLPAATAARGGLNLFGRVLDESGVAGVQVCVDGRCDRASVPAADQGSARWTYRLPVAPADYVSKTISITGTDRVGNRTAALQATVTVDNVAPELTATQPRDRVALGERQVVLQGTVQDGGPGPRVFVRVQAPDGTRTRQNANVIDVSSVTEARLRDNVKDTSIRGDAGVFDAWDYQLAGEMPGRYLFWLEAVDRTGNTRTMGPYAVDVTCVDARLQTSLTSARSGESAAYAVTATITNTGPAGLPAGAPVTFYAGDAPFGPPATLPALQPGEAGAVLTVWTRPEAVRYQLSAVVGEPPAEVLCATPPMAKTWAGPAPDLRISKTVQPAAALPGSVITYTLTYSNAGDGLATGVAIGDPLPLEILAPSYQASGAAITETAGLRSFAWQVADLAGGEGGRIVISGTLDPVLAQPVTITNVVTITSALEGALADNVASAPLRVLPEIVDLPRRVWLPLMVR